MIIDLENISQALSDWFSPKYLPAMTAAPLANIEIIPHTIVINGITIFTEARGIAPTKFPIKIPSTIMADEIAIMPKTDGTAKRTNSRLILPVIIFWFVFFSVKVVSLTVLGLGS